MLCWLALNTSRCSRATCKLSDKEAFHGYVVNGTKAMGHNPFLARFHPQLYLLSKYTSTQKPPVIMDGVCFLQALMALGLD